jgi:hypothetical protein
MGVDISGIAPQIVGERPKELNWDTATDYEKSQYFNAMDIFYSNNPGVYFRSNWWGWRPIHAIADMAIKLMELPLDTHLWGENSGGGLKNQEECDMLADAIEAFMMLNNANMHDEEDRFYLCLGGWGTADGSFIGPNRTEKLNQDYPIGTVLYNGVVAEDGTLVFPSHSAPLYHITNFVTFLRKCGGFEIW